MLLKQARNFRRLKKRPAYLNDFMLWECEVGWMHLFDGVQSLCKFLVKLYYSSVMFTNLIVACCSLQQQQQQGLQQLLVSSSISIQ